MADLLKIEALAQRGLTDRQIMVSLKLEAITIEQMEAIERGRAAGVAIINSKLFDRANAGEPKAVEAMNKKFEQLEGKRPKSYSEEQLEVLRNLMK